MNSRIHVAAADDVETQRILDVNVNKVKKMSSNFRRGCHVNSSRYFGSAS